MISVENLQKSFGAQSLFDGVSFKINQRERVGLVGRNGHGKTTLFRIVTGREQADSGAVIVPKQYRIGYVRQHLDFREDTVLKEGMRGLCENERDHHWKVEKILSGLGFSQSDMNRPPSEFSGGYQVRLNLAKVLVSDPDLLMLDEPTNFLDITSIRWIERFLMSWPRELMLITHDRGFMDKVVTHTVGIHRKKARKIPGNTEQYYSQIAQDEEIYEKTRVNDERRKKDIELFITRFRAKARLAGMVQSRIKTLEKMEKKDKLESVKTLDFSFRYKHFKGKHVMSANGLGFSYDPAKPLIRNFNISVGPGERICIVGKNGKGKTTLIKLLAGELSAKSGEIIYNPNIAGGFYEQTNVKSLVDGRTVEEEILYSGENLERTQVRNICGAMMFEGDAALKKIGVLSGGEKSRVMLGKLIATSVNLIFLDEPTNHLDMESCDSLLAALNNFKGSVILVTHNEMFLHALAQRLIVFTEDGIEVFDGGYSEFLEKGGWGDEPSTLRSKRAPENPENDQKISKKELRRRRSEIIAERSKVVTPLQDGIDKAEREIEEREKRMGELNEAMQEATLSGDGKKIAELSQSIHACEADIEKLFDDLESLTEELETKKAGFEKMLDAQE